MNPFAGAFISDLFSFRPQELPLLPGPLLDIGPLKPSGVDGILIPPGFSLRRVAVSGEPCKELGSSPFSSRQLCVWHSFPDGGAVFPADDGWVYVSNSEMSVNGGASAIRFSSSGQVEEIYQILSNTRRNCAGGPTPWGTWLSCEEVPDGRVFECDPLGDQSCARVLPSLGIFNHEAAAVDWKSRTIFLTEDASDGRLYRFRSKGIQVAANGRLGLDFTDGYLEVLEIEGFEAGVYQRSLKEARKIQSVKWVPVVSPEHPQHEVRLTYSEQFGHGAPGTRFNGGEGIWIYELPEANRSVPPAGNSSTRAVVYFACKGDNRIYAIDIENDLIEVVFDNEQLAFPNLPFSDVDNLTVSPSGDVIVAEDGEEMRLMVMNPNGPSKILLQVPGGGSELTGPAFTPDGIRLYFSSQRGSSEGPGILGFGITYELTLPLSLVRNK